ncbi:uncharacterized protein LOC111053266 [Nilaparvata lugens]|uniref:uncharacterized protein LOC111053266 n=1 Tax=Nilaparvata lugens TaxID=108931 RepID=UPI00193D1DE9|nr:uncharacterized protein LOC111053266 [Nilaparvata lugens]
MDDLKLYAKSPEQLENLLQLVTTFSQCIKMKLGLEKCAVLHVKKGKVVNTAEGMLTLENEIGQLQIGQTYKYLGLHQHLKISRVEVFSRLEIEFKRRLSKVMKSKLPSKHLIKAINSWVIPSLTYSFGVLKWSDTRLEQMDRLVRTQMTKNRVHHPRSLMSRLYMPRKLGGRGLSRVSDLCAKQEKRLREYFISANTNLLREVCRLDENYTALNLRNPHGREPLTVYDYNAEWQQRELHGRYCRHLNSDHNNHDLSSRWLIDGGLFPETEGFIIDMQDQVVTTNAYRRHIIRDLSISDKCRLCNAAVESIQHIVSGCSILAPKEYLRRHNNVAKIVHLKLQQEFDFFEEMPPYYSYSPPAFIERNQIKIYWDVQMITDRQVIHNKPDILMLNMNQKEALIIDVAIPADEN